ncbi:DUF2243 domain-containing protein [Modestobacter lapidis]
MAPPADPRARALSGRSVGTGVLIGVGVAGFVDEVVFHQLLHWHHFYDRGTSAAGLVSDGLFHAFSWTAVVVGLFVLADLHRRQATVPRRVWAGGLTGAGAFQVYDGLVHHKLLQVHQVRYGVDLLPYDVAWLVSGAVPLVVGLLLLRGPARPLADVRR